MKQWEENYFKPVYYIEIGQSEVLFPLRVGNFHEPKEVVIAQAKKNKMALRVVEKSMATGKETTVWERK